MNRAAVFLTPSSFDANGDGHITHKELKKIVTDIHGLLKKEEEDDALGAADGNGGGGGGGGKKNRGGSFKLNLKKKDLSEVAFKEMDANQDGKVSGAGTMRVSHIL